MTEKARLEHRRDYLLQEIAACMYTHNIRDQRAYEEELAEVEKLIRTESEGSDVY